MANSNEIVMISSLLVQKILDDIKNHQQIQDQTLKQVGVARNELQGKINQVVLFYGDENIDKQPFIAFSVDELEWQVLAQGQPEIASVTRKWELLGKQAHSALFKCAKKLLIDYDNSDFGSIVKELEKEIQIDEARQKKQDQLQEVVKRADEQFRASVIGVNIKYAKKIFKDGVNPVKK